MEAAAARDDVLDESGQVREGVELGLVLDPDGAGDRVGQPVAVPNEASSPATRAASASARRASTPSASSR